MIRAGQGVGGCKDGWVRENVEHGDRKEERKERRHKK